MCLCQLLSFLVEGLNYTMPLLPLGYGLIATKLGYLATQVHNARPRLVLRLRDH